MNADGPATYLDSSAIVKLVVEEPESTALRRYLRRRRPLVSSSLARAEVLRALLHEGDVGLARGRDVLGRIDMIRVTDKILRAAGVLMPTDLRTLDAIHVASAQLVGTDLGQVVTYDRRMLTALQQLGLKTTSPT
ncbi:MAG: type II toxin-antitoxin system VapC family toxin [Actinomycetota bacterium]|nr:type II toxin-antitoxin system VapC family toxin [Actinomycetota bacterium]